jgi:hypothetical protein
MLLHTANKKDTLLWRLQLPGCRPRLSLPPRPLPAAKVLHLCICSAASPSGAITAVTRRDVGHDVSALAMLDTGASSGSATMLAVGLWSANVIELISCAGVQCHQSRVWRGSLLTMGGL